MPYPGFQECCCWTWGWGLQWRAAIVPLQPASPIAKGPPQMARSALCLPHAETWPSENPFVTPAGRLSFRGQEGNGRLRSCESLQLLQYINVLLQPTLAASVIPIMPTMYHLDSFSIRSSCSG